MKKFLFILLVFACLVGVANALTYDQANYKKNRQSVLAGTGNDPLYNFIGEVDDLFTGTATTGGITNLLFSEETADPTSTEGRIYYNTTSNLFKFYNGSAWTNFAAESGTVSLDIAYNNGNSIDVDGTAVTLTVSDTDNNAALIVAQNDSTNDPDAMNITSAADAAGAVGLQIDCTAGFDIQGTSDSWSVSIAGLVDGEGLTGVTNSQGILFDTNNEIQFGDNSEDVAFNFAVANTLTLATDTAVDKLDFGVVDALSGVAAIAGDAGADFALSAANTGTFNFTIAQTGVGDNELRLTSAGTAANAIQLTASTGGITADAVDDIIVTCASSAGADDFVLQQTGAFDASVLIKAAGTGSDAISAVATAGGIVLTAVDDMVLTCASSAGADDLTIQQTGAFDASVLLKSAGTGDDAISSVATAGWVLVQSSGATDNHIVISGSGTSANALQLTTTAGGIVVTNGGASGEDILIDGVLSAVGINSDEATTDAIDISATAGGITMASTAVASTWTHTATGAADDLSLIVAGAVDGSLVLSSAGTSTNAIDINATAGGIDIDISGGAATEDFAVTTDTSITLIATEAVADQFKVDAQGTVAGDAINLETSDGGIMLNADGGTNGDIELNAASEIIFTAAGAFTVDITGAGTYKGSWLPDSIVTTTETSTTLDTTDIGKITKVTADAQTITLPATVVGYVYTIFYDGADGGALVTVELDNADQFLGCDIAGAVGEALLLTKATSDRGDYVRVVGDGADGWKIVEMNGTWAEASP